MQTTHHGHVSIAHASFCTLILLSASRLCALDTFVSFLFLKYAELNLSAWTTLLLDSQTAPDSHLKSVQIQDPRMPSLTVLPQLHLAKARALFNKWMNRFGGNLEKAMATHSSTLAWKIPWMEKPGRLQSMGSWRVGHDWALSVLLFTFMHWRRKWQPTPVFLPGESQGWRSLVGCGLWGHTESDTTEAT